MHVLPSGLGWESNKEKGIDFAERPLVTVLTDRNEWSGAAGGGGVQERTLGLFQPGA